MFGLVPSMFKEVPDSELELEWKLFKKVQFEQGAIPNKLPRTDRAGDRGGDQVPYCIFYHAELARLNGATDAEIEDAPHYAKSSVGWSAYISGLQIDFETFKNEIEQACEHVRSMQKAA